MPALSRQLDRRYDRRRDRRYDQVGEVLIRPAWPDDARELVRLAQLDSQARLDGPVLIAALDGVAVAALELRTGRLVADPFVHTAAVCDLLRVREASIARNEDRLRRMLRVRRLAPAAARQA